MPTIFSPSSNSFKTQHPGEEVILATQKHWYTLFAPLLLLVIFSATPFVIYFFIKDTQFFTDFAPIYWFLVSACLFLIWNFAFFKIMIYSLNVVIVTSERVMENKQLGFFKHTVNEVPLEQIQDISVHIYGMSASFFDFGDIEIQTAGTQNKFYFAQLPKPKEIKEIIMKTKGKFS